MIIREFKKDISGFFRVTTWSKLVCGLTVLFFIVSKDYASHSKIDDRSQSEKRLLIYTPRTTDLSPIRIKSNSRNPDKLPSLFALAPDHASHTISQQPTLYWYQSSPAAAKFEVMIMGQDKTKPVFKKTYDTADWSGIQRLELGDHSINLDKDVQYTWTVSLIPDPKHRSKDMIAIGVIELIDPPENLAPALLTKNQKDLVYILSKEGIWYDAIEKISQMIELHPQRSEFRELRAELLEQVGLIEVAEHDRERAKK